MKEVAIMMASMMPEEHLVDEIEEAVKNYKEAKLLNSSQEVIDEKRKKLTFVSMLMVMREQTEGKMEKSFELMKEMEEIDKAKNLFKKTN